MKWHREWFIGVPWGKLALASRGHPDGEPVLLVHGRQDSLSIFEPLMKEMSDQYYYVAIDMPGNGLSDAFPHGPKLMRFHFLYAMELALRHLGWDRFIFVGHSMGCEQGLFYNVLYPGQISKMILLDAGPTLMRMQIEDSAEYQSLFFDPYYEKYKKETLGKRIRLKYTVTESMQRLRELSRAQCNHLLSRNFKEIKAENPEPSNAIQAQSSNQAHGSNELPNLSEAENGKDSPKLPPNGNGPRDGEEPNEQDGSGNPNRPQNANGRDNSESRVVGYLSWDNRLKNLAPQNYGNDYYFELFKSIPPTLLIAASDGAKNVPPIPKWRQGAKELLDKMATLDNFHRVDVEGSHDVHYTHPERVLPFINAFLQDNKVSSKL